MPRRPVIVFAAAILMVAIAIALCTLLVVNSRTGAGDEDTNVASGQSVIGGDFTLVDQNGRQVDQTMLDGKWSLVFFGFTYCPDFCPTTLGVLDQVQEQLGEDADKLQIIFISIDPARDTPQMLKDYLSSDGFPDNVIGLTGSEAQVAQAAKVYRALYSKVGEGEAYTMNHTLTVYLMGPDGQFRSPLAHDLGPARTVKLIRDVMARG